MTIPSVLRATLLRPPETTGVLLVVVLALLVSACSSEGSAPTVDGPDATDGTSFSQADITFLQGMVPHHAQAVEMAQLVVDRTAHPEELNPLAEDIITAQQDEIETMNGLLVDAGEDPVEDSTMGGMDHGEEGDMGDTEMSGMMSTEDMTALATAEGDAFDGMFLEMMIAHHEGAIEAAGRVLDAADGNPEVASLAEGVIVAQEGEIAQMEAWQDDWQV